MSGEEVCRSIKFDQLFGNIVQAAIEYFDIPSCILYLPFIYNVYSIMYNQRGGPVVSLRGRHRTRRWEIRVRIPGRGNAR